MRRSPAPDTLFLALQAALAGRYSLEREIGRGGMGIVYLARDVRLDRPVALKLLPPERAAIAVMRERFLHEARMAARLAHPNIVPIHAVEEVGDFVFYAMRYVSGETLGDRLRRFGRLGSRDAAAILRDTAFALAYAHAQAVIHRDIKPDNILLEADTDRALVTDFGIARLADVPDHARGRLVGTPEYVAPEQAAGSYVDARADLYALGAVGFHCIAGRPPFEGDVASLLQQHLMRDPPTLSSLVPDVPPALARAIDRALAKEPDDRFANAESMAEAIAPPPVTGELPVPVRVWVERGRDLKGIYVIWSCFFYGMATMAYVGSAMSGQWPWQAVVFMVLALKATVLPWVGHGLWRLSETRKALEAGVTVEDLRYGADVAVRKREEEMRYEHSRPPHPFARLVRRLTYVALAGAIGMLIGGVFVSRSGEQSKLFFQLFGLFTMATVGGALFGLVFPGRQLKPRDAFARLRRAFWHSPLADWMARIATVGLPRVRANAWSSWRPTEIALGSATETLFASLPANDRALLHDLPRVVERLERDAALSRSRLDRGEAGPWSERLERSVAAIETLRMGLLRMNAGSVAAGSLTAELDAARELSERIDQLMAGAAEADAALEEDRSPRQSAAQPMPRDRAPSTSLG